MREALGNLWTYPADIRGITTNGFVKSDGACVMGRGCAREARDRYPGLDMRLGTAIREHGNRCFYIRVLDGTLLTFPVKPARGADGKPGWACKADLEIIAQSATQAVEMADKFGWTAIVLPRPGAGNGHLDYAAVRSVIAPILDDRFSVITFGRDG